MARTASRSQAVKISGSGASARMVASQAVELVEHGGVGAAGLRRGDHQRLQPGDGRREHVGLGRAHARDVVAVAVDDQLLDALLAVLGVPVVGEVVGIVGPDDARRWPCRWRPWAGRRRAAGPRTSGSPSSRRSHPSRARARGRRSCWRDRAPARAPARSGRCCRSCRRPPCSASARRRGACAPCSRRRCARRRRPCRWRWWCRRRSAPSIAAPPRVPVPADPRDCGRSPAAPDRGACDGARGCARRRP